MKILIAPLDEKHWTISKDGQKIGSVERLMTGYLVTLTASPDAAKKIKRYRMIDALREAFGAEAELEIQT